jgi:hypothetical protein
MNDDTATRLDAHEARLSALEQWRTSMSTLVLTLQRENRLDARDVKERVERMDRKLDQLLAALSVPVDVQELMRDGRVKP